MNQNPHQIGAPARRDDNKFATTNITNELREYIAGHHPIPQTANGLGPELGQAWAFIGRVVTSGPEDEADFTDNRYWVQPLLIKSGGVSDVLVLVNDVHADQGGYPVVPVTDLTGKPLATTGEEAGDHSLEEGTFVYVFAAYDSAGPDAQLHYFIFSGGGAIPKGQYKYMLLQMVTDFVAGYDFDRLHPLVSLVD